MIKSFVHFIKYNNFAVLGILAVLAGAGSALAVTGEGAWQSPPTTLDEQMSIDAEVQPLFIESGALLDIDMESFDPNPRLTLVVEDTDVYEVSYTLDSWGVEEGVWKSIAKTNTLTITKQSLLVSGMKLKDAIAKELREVAQQEKTYLKEAQNNEAKENVAKKQVALNSKALKGFVVNPPEVVGKNTKNKSASETQTMLDTSQTAEAESESVPTQEAMDMLTSQVFGTATLNPMAVDFTNTDGSFGEDGLDDFTGKSMTDPDALARNGKSLFIPTTVITDKSRIFLTQKTVSDEPLAVTSKEVGVGFTVSVKNATLEPVAFDWLIVEEK